MTDRFVWCHPVKYGYRSIAPRSQRCSRRVLRNSPECGEFGVVDETQHYRRLEELPPDRGVRYDRTNYEPETAGYLAMYRNALWAGWRTGLVARRRSGGPIERTPAIRS